MSRLILRRSLLVSVLLSCSFFLFSQSSSREGYCGYVGKSAWLEAYQAGEIAVPRQVADSMVVGLKLHVVGTTDGAGYMNMRRLMNAVRIVQEDFAPSGIHFYIEGDINFINNTSYYRHEVPTGRIMMSLNNEPGVVNCYIVQDPAGNCGYYSGSRDALVVGKNCLDGIDRTFSHEIGHYLSLPHTFVGWEGHYVDNEISYDTTAAPLTIGNRLVEKADSTNCQEAADGFCDTPADYLSYRWGCNGDGEFRDTLLDPDTTKFIVRGWPIMSYANDACVAPLGEGFSGEQEQAMIANLTTQRGSLIREGINFGTEAANGDDIQLLLPEDGTNVNPVDEISVSLHWSSVANADFYVIQLNNSPFFGANVPIEITVSDTTVVLTAAEGLEENERYYWRVMPINRFRPFSDFGDEVFDFRVRDLLSSTYDPELEAAVSVYPNPVPAGRGELTLRADNLPGNEGVTFTLIDATGRRIFTRTEYPVGGSVFLRSTLSASMTTGVYFLQIRQGQRISRRKVLVH